MSVAFGVAAAAAYCLPWPIILLDSAGLRIPLFFQNVVFGWPQWVFFILYKSGDQGGLFLPWRWAYLFPVGFWIAAALVFGLAARRVKSMLVLFPLATTFVVAVVFLAGRIVPMLGYRIRVVGP